MDRSLVPPRIRTGQFLETTTKAEQPQTNCFSDASADARRVGVVRAHRASGEKFLNSVRVNGLLPAAVARF